MNAAELGKFVEDQVHDPAHLFIRIQQQTAILSLHEADGRVQEEFTPLRFVELSALQPISHGD